MEIVRKKHTLPKFSKSFVVCFMKIVICVFEKKEFVVTHCHRPKKHSPINKHKVEIVNTVLTQKIVSVCEKKKIVVTQKTYTSQIFQILCFLLHENCDLRV